MTLLTVLATWTLLSVLVAGLCAALFEGARRVEAAALSGLPARPAAAGVVPVALPAPRSSVEHLVSSGA